jgi:hypothetical protein
MNPRGVASNRVKVSVRSFRAILLAAPVAISLGQGTAYGDGAAPGADRETPPQKLGVSAATSYLASGAGSGVAVSSGLRLTLGAHAALGADLGYGVLSAPSATQDRWWIIPTIAWVVPTEYTHLDLGVGLGVGAASGYVSFADYAGRPFAPAWAFQLVPAARLHVMWSTPLRGDLDLFARIDVAALVLSGTQLGFRNGNPNPGPGDTTWFDIGAGVQFRLL